MNSINQIENYMRYFNDLNEKGIHGIFTLTLDHLTINRTGLFVSTFIVDQDRGYYSRLLYNHIKKLITAPVNTNISLVPEVTGFVPRFSNNSVRLTKTYESTYALPIIEITDNRYHEFMSSVVLKDGSKWKVLKWHNTAKYGRFYALIQPNTEEIKIVRADNIVTPPTLVIETIKKYSYITTYTDFEHNTKKTVMYDSSNVLGTNTVHYYYANTCYRSLSLMDLPIYKGIVIDPSALEKYRWMIIDKLTQEQIDTLVSEKKEARYKYLYRKKVYYYYSVKLPENTTVTEYLIEYYQKIKINNMDEISKIPNIITDIESAISDHVLCLKSVTGTAISTLKNEISRLETYQTELINKRDELEHEITELDNVLTYLKNYKKLINVHINRPLHNN